MRNSRRIICLVLMICMVMSVFSFKACYFPEHERLNGLGTHEGLDAKTELELIKWKFGEGYQGQISVDEFNAFQRYVGVYNEYVILYASWSEEKAINEIGGLLFSSRTGIVAWKDNREYTLHELYDNELLSKEDLEKIHLRHQELTFPCYGNYNGYQVFVLRGGWGFESFSCVMAWKDEKFYTLQKLYDNCILTKEDLEEIHLKNQWRFRYRVYSDYDEYNDIYYYDHDDEYNIYDDSWNHGLGLYYGVYGDYMAYNFTAGYSEKVIIDGLEFDTKIKIMKDGEVCLLKDVYEGGFLTRTDLEEIYLKHNEFVKFGDTW